MATAATAASGAPSAAAPAAAPAGSPKGRLRNARGQLRSDGGGTCPESNSPQICQRRESAQQALRRHQSAGRVSDRVVAALLNSPLTLPCLPRALSLSLLR